MEYPGLLSVLLNEDCSQHIAKEEPRLRALATANGSNQALIAYLDCFKKTGACPNAEGLKSYISTMEKGTPESISVDLDNAAQWRSASPGESFPIAMERSWTEAQESYVRFGYTMANKITVGMIPPGMTQYSFEKRMMALYGEMANWDRLAFSEIWHNEYKAANPFTKKVTFEVQGEVLATGVVIDDEEVAHNVSLVATSYANIEMLPTNWLWPDKIPAGFITWWAGKGGCGKSASLCDLIARVSAGLPFPDGTPNTQGPRKVLFGSSEDDSQRTLKPRLEVAGANMDNVKRLDGIVTGEGIHSMFALKENLPLLIQSLENNPDIGLVCLDAISSFWGDVNSNAENEMKPLMDALKTALERTQCTFVGIIHNNKRSDSDALGKVMGAGCIANSARAVFGFGFDPEDETRKRRMMSLIKCNLTENTGGMYFTIENQMVEGLRTAHVVWGDKHNSTADDVMAVERDQSGQRREGKQITKAVEFLKAALINGARPAVELLGEASAQGINKSAMYRAKDQLMVINWPDTKKHCSMWGMEREQIPIDADVI